MSKDHYTGFSEDIYKYITGLSLLTGISVLYYLSSELGNVTFIPNYLLIIWLIAITFAIQSIEIHISILLISAVWNYNYYIQLEHSFYWFLLIYYLLFFIIRYKLNILKVIRPSYQEIFLGLFLIWAFFSLTYSQMPFRTLNRSLGFLGAFMLMKVLREYDLVRGLDLKKLAISLSVGFLPYLIYILSLQSHGQRPATSLVHPNILGMEISLIAILSMIIILDAMGKITFKHTSLLYILTLGSVFFGSLLMLLFTDSRAALLATSVGGAFSLALLRPKLKETLTVRTLVVVSIPLVILFIVFLLPELQENFPNAIIWELTKGNFGEYFFARKVNRLELWGAILNIQNPFIGQGFGAAPEVTVGSVHVESSGVHNSYLQIFRELGIVGFILYGLFLIGVIQKLMRLIRIRGLGNSSIYTLAIGGVIVCILTDAFFESGALFAPSLVYTIFFYVCVGLLENRTSEQTLRIKRH